MNPRRLLLVHAHPDDETSSTGGTMAHYAADGATVTLVTCTLGERGAVVVPDLLHLRHDNDDILGTHRLGELTVAMESLGVTDFVRLGGDGRWSDSGMSDTDDGLATVGEEMPENAFWTADLEQAAAELVAIIRDRRPQVLISDNSSGSYGHPDHVQAHRVATYAAVLAGVAAYRPDLGGPWSIDRTLWTAIPVSLMRIWMLQAKEAGEPFAQHYDPESPALPPMGTPDEYIAVTIDTVSYRQQVYAAMHAHRSQIPLDSFFFTGEKDVDPVAGRYTESFVLASGVPFPAGADDLFVGLT